MSDIDYLSINRVAWDTRTPIHVDSDFYDLPSFLEGKNALTKIDRAFMPDVNGKSLVHLQCHFGMDTLSWKKLGATVTELDLSPKSIATAKELSQKTGLTATFVEGNVLEASSLINERFDIVYTRLGRTVLAARPNRLGRRGKKVTEARRRAQHR